MSFNEKRYEVELIANLFQKHLQDHPTENFTLSNK